MSLSPRKLLCSHIPGCEHLLDLGNQLCLALLVEQLRGARLHLGVDQPGHEVIKYFVMCPSDVSPNSFIIILHRPDGPLPDDLLAGVDLAEDADDGAAGVASDERHDAVLDDGDLLLVLGLQQLHQHVHDLGQVLGVLVLAQGGQVLDSLQQGED